MRILGIDPGSLKSAIVEWDGQAVTSAREDYNTALLPWIAQEASFNLCAIESPTGWTRAGHAMTNEVMETIRTVGAFRYVVEERKRVADLITPPTIRAFLCGSARANDKDVKKMLVARYADDLKFWGITNTHYRAALAVAITADAIYWGSK